MTARRPIVFLVALAAALPAAACPFCVAESRTLTEEMNDASVVAVARLVRPSAASEKLADADIPPAFIDPETGAAEFAVEDFLKGEEVLGDTRLVEAIHFGDPDTDRRYLLRGLGDPLDWAIPLPLSDIAQGYVRELTTLPEEGSERLAFFLPYLMHEESLLDQDSYDEFARAPYQDVIDIGPLMDRGKLRGWIVDPDLSPSRRRLALTMLGVCGEASDVQSLREQITTDERVLGLGADAGVSAAVAAGGAPTIAVLAEAARYSERQRKIGLDALIACYLTLAARHDDASEALDLIDDRYLRGGANYSNIFSVVRALRFLGDEQEELVPRERMLASAHLLLDEPEFADQIITDLSRWEDWSVLDRLSEMYLATFEENNPEAPRDYIREPVITYMDVAAQVEGDVGERARAALEKIEPLDPEAVERARELWAFGALARAREPGPEPPWESAKFGEPPARFSETDDAPLPSDDFVPPNPQPETDYFAGSPPPASGEKATPEMTGGDAPDKIEGAAPAAEAVASQDAGRDSPATPEEAPPTPPAERALESRPETPPPSRLVLIVTPLAATAAMIGLFWLILRGGVS